jgi:hypothetical protein
VVTGSRPGFFSPETGSGLGFLGPGLPYEPVGVLQLSMGCRGFFFLEEVSGTT